MGIEMAENAKKKFMDKLISFKNEGVFKNIIFTVKEKDEISFLLFTNAKLLKLRYKYDKMIEPKAKDFPYGKLDYSKMEIEKLKFDIEVHEEILGIHKPPRNMADYEEVETTWNHIKTACYDKTHNSYHTYGSRGIKMHKPWLDILNFIQDMGECPKGLSIQRIDEDGDFTPDNCCWCTNQGIISVQSQENVLDRARKIVEIRKACRNEN